MAQIKDEHVTPELRARADDMKRQRGLPTLGFYEQLMAYPDLFEHIASLGTFLRFHSALPPLAREAEVLMVATELRSPFEWQTHVDTATAAGVTPDLFHAIAMNGPLDGPLTDLRAVVRCVAAQSSVPQEVFDRLASTYGIEGAVEAVTLACFYRMNASLAAAFDSAMPGAAPPPWEGRGAPRSEERAP